MEHIGKNQQNGEWSEIYSILEKTGLKGPDILKIIHFILTMASANVLDRIDTSYARLESKFDAQNSKIDAQNSKIDAQNSKIDSQNSKYNLLIGLVTGGLTVIVALLIAIMGWLLNNGGV